MTFAPARSEAHQGKSDARLPGRTHLLADSVTDEDSLSRYETVPDRVQAWASTIALSSFKSQSYSPGC